MTSFNCAVLLWYFNLVERATSSPLSWRLSEIASLNKFWMKCQRGAAISPRSLLCFFIYHPRVHLMEGELEPLSLWSSEAEQVAEPGLRGNPTGSFQALERGLPHPPCPHSYQATFLPSKWMSITSPAPSSHLGLPNVSAVGTVAVHLGAKWRTWLRFAPISFVLKTKASFLQGKWEGGPVGVGDGAHTSSPGPPPFIWDMRCLNEIPKILSPSKSWGSEKLRMNELSPLWKWHLGLLAYDWTMVPAFTVLRKILSEWWVVLIILLWTGLKAHAPAWLFPCNSIHSIRTRSPNIYVVTDPNSPACPVTAGSEIFEH